MSKADLESKKVVTPTFRVSFPYIFKPSAFKDQEPKYSLTMLFDKKTDLSPLKKIMKAAAVEKWGIDQKKWPKFKHPVFRDGDADKPDTQGYENTIFTTAKSKTQPGLVDQRLQPILNERDFYAGCFARAEIIAYAYDQAGNKGIGFSLQNIQKTAEGDRLGGRKDAADVFEAVEDTSEDEESYNSSGKAEDPNDDMFT